VNAKSNEDRGAPRRSSEISTNMNLILIERHEVDDAGGFAWLTDGRGTS
jgi:hypothetical protein